MSRRPKPLDPAVEAEIRRIALDASEAGWTPDLLWEPRFWNIVGMSNRPGLAACMRPGYKIAEVTPDCIEIETDEGNRQRFYNPDRDHSWLKHLR